MNQVEAGFCQACHAFIDLAPIGGIPDHGDSCPGRFHRPATLILGPNWISWTIAANSYVRSVLIDPVTPEVLEQLRRSQREN